MAGGDLVTASEDARPKCFGTLQHKCLVAVFLLDGRQSAVAVSGIQRIREAATGLFIASLQIVKVASETMSFLFSVSSMYSYCQT